jgi:hypothetical protein
LGMSFHNEGRPPAVAQILFSEDQVGGADLIGGLGVRSANYTNLAAHQVV